ncbi:MAG TPA: sigma 54-interacting transcriptional regulator [Oscillospiraceae bacterium]|nr:sigma 54-interacting transcriptional regulator [Oscillospiraceae bacterium]
MKPTIAIMSYRWLTSLIRKIEGKFIEHVNLTIIDALLEDALAEAQKMEEKQHVDVFVSAGGNARLLAQYLNSPFLEIQVTGFDILLALKKAGQYGDRIGVLTYRHKLPYLAEVTDMLNYDVRELTYNALSNIDIVLEQLQNEGINTVVGASLVLERAQERGMNGVFIYSVEGIERTLESAVKIAYSKKIESEKAERLRVILDFAYSGIIATDKYGKITAFNPSAAKIMGITRRNVMGRSVSKAIPNTRLMEVLTSAQSELNQIQSIGEIKILTNRVPIMVNGEVTGAVATFQDISAIQKAEETIRARLYKKGFLAKATVEDVLGDSVVMRQVKRKACLYAKTDSTVLIFGESGTGKELFAQGIHNASTRSKRPFIAVNCAALPENLLESELFGYEDGAFTGARKGGKAGYFELAHGGTIFLDEIGEISEKLQARLLRVLEEREVMRIGGDRIIPVNIRVVAATNRKLWQLVEKGKFRQDLYYRINVLELEIPPLRHRKEDIQLLGGYFLANFRRELERGEIAEIMSYPQFQSYHWPGNVRELKNVMERLAVLYENGTDYKELLATFFNKQNAVTLLNSEEEEIEKVLQEVGGNKSEAAKRLGISRTSLWRKLKKYETHRNN